MASVGNIGDKLDLLFRQGSTLGPIPVQMTQPDSEPVDLTGCTVRAKIRKTFSAATAYTVSCAVTDAALGKFEFTLSPAITASIPCGSSKDDDASKYVWDLEIEYADGTVKPVFYGVVKVAPEATK